MGKGLINQKKNRELAHRKSKLMKVNNFLLEKSQTTLYMSKKFLVLGSTVRYVKRKSRAMPKRKSIRFMRAKLSK